MAYTPPGPHLIDPLPTYAELDELVDVDPIKLRDVAAQLVKRIEKLENPEAAERSRIAEAICNSEAFMWLMVGSNHVDLQLSSLRHAWDKYSKLGGGWGKSR